MRRRNLPSTFLIALTAVVLAATGSIAGRSATASAATGGTAASVAAAPVRIMPLGDSITAGTGCWRAMLWHRLQLGGYLNVDFVGSVSDGGSCNLGYPYDPDHEGHGGYSATGIADNNQLPPWLAAAHPDIMLVHLGTNDMWGGYIPLATKLAAFTKLVGQMRAENPNMKIIVAQIIPMSQSACQTCPADVVAFDSALPAWAAGLSTAQSPIVLADQWTGFDATADTVDGVHPNTSGFEKMAARWYPALTQVLDGTATPPPTPTPTVTPTVTPTATPTVTPTPTSSSTASPSPSTGTRACSATYTVISQWPGGFQGEVAVRNDSAGASSAWTVTFALGSGTTITQTWNAALVQSGSSVTAQNVGYNGTLAAGATTSFGFLASSGATAGAVPAVTCTLT